MGQLPKLIVVLGATASGKTDIGISIAKDFNGEVVSADSRQIFKKMRIGTATPKGDWKKYEGEMRYMVEGVPHYLMDIIDPGKTFTVAEYKEVAMEKISDILNRGKTPIVVGGTGLYVWSLVDNLSFPKSVPNKKLRESFESKTAHELMTLLSKLDPEAAAVVDAKNKRRLIRALEVAITTGESFAKQRQKTEPIYDCLQIGINWPAKELYERIELRIDKQMEEGLLDEVKGLVKQSYSFDLPSMSSIGYKQMGAFLHGEVTEKEAINWFKKDTRNYAKRQVTWFKRDKRIKWIERNDYKTCKELIKDFLQ